MKKKVIITIIFLCLIVSVFYLIKSNDSNKVSKIYSDQEYVIDGAKYYPDVSNKSVYTYLSMVNLDSDYAKEVNNSISNNVLYNDYDENMNVTYEWHLNDNILSVVVRVRGEAQEGRLDSWSNIDVDTGKKVELTEVLKRKNISLDDFNKRVNAILTNYANKCYTNVNFTGGYTKLEDGTTFKNSLTKDEFIERSISDLPSTNEIPFYLDEDGDINFVVSLISCGGPEGMWTYQFDLNDDLEETESSKKYLNIYRAGDGMFSTNENSGNLIFSIETETDSGELLDVDVRNGINVLYNDNGMKIYNVAKKSVINVNLEDEYEYYKLYKNSGIIARRNFRASYYDVSNNKMMFEDEYYNLFFADDSYISGLLYKKSNDYTAYLLNIKTADVVLTDDDAYYIMVKENDGKEYYIAEDYYHDVISIYSGLKEVVYTTSLNSGFSFYNGYLYTFVDDSVTKFDNDGKKIKSLELDDIKDIVNNCIVYLEDGYLKVIDIDSEKELFKVEWNDNYKFVSSYYMTQEDIDENRIVDGIAGLYVDVRFINSVKESDKSQVGISYIYSVDGKFVEQSKYNYDDIEDVNAVVNEYIVNELFNDSFRSGEKAFGAFYTFLQEKNGDDIILYTWTDKDTLYVKDGKLAVGTGTGTPVKYVVRKENNLYKVVDVKYPTSGIKYGEDMKTIFPDAVRNEIYNIRGTGILKKLSDDIMSQGESYYGISNDSLKIYADKDYVYNGIKYKPKYADSEYYAYMPFININSDYVKSLNDYLNSDEFANTDEEYYTAEYEWHLNGNILSVVVRKQSLMYKGSFDFWTNIDITTGEELKLSDVLNLRDISVDNFNKMVNNALNDYANRCYTWSDFTEYIGFTKDEFIKKSNDDLPSINEIPFYLDEDGDIHFVTTLISCGGPSGEFPYELELEE